MADRMVDIAAIDAENGRLAIFLYELDREQHAAKKAALTLGSGGKYRVFVGFKAGES
ncbi:MAG: hypothetical protein HC795_01360 [Coleofasciculaceae cyanobacterium RL_1_1]|nr:hypothetical protein [Coleofasciculaceae cyanobacterium RL_1_1]